jgi:hypothetical protein
MDFAALRSLGGILVVVLAAAGASCAQAGTHAPGSMGGGGDAGDDSSAALQGLVSLSVTPTSSSLSLVYASSIAPAQVQLTATGTFQDGSTRDVTGAVGWTIDPSSLATTADGMFASSVAGKFSVTASWSQVSAAAAVLVKLTGDVVDPGAQAAKQGLDGTPGGSPPTVAYPLDGALFPFGLAPIEFQMVPSATAQTVGRVAFEGDLIDLRVYEPCTPIAQPAIAGACTLALPVGLATHLAGVSEADVMSERVRLSAQDGTGLVESSSLDVRWSPDALHGGLYFWSAQTVAQGGMNELMRYDLDNPTAGPQVYYTDADTKALESQTQYYQPCFGCHSISLDGTRVGLTFGGSVPSLFALLDVATKKPFTSGTQVSLRISDGDAPGFQANNGFATQTVFSPDGLTMVQAFRGQLLPRVADASLADKGAALFTSTLDPMGENATQPFWSADGTLFAFASWLPPNGQQLTGDIVTGAQLWMASVDATGAFQTPKVLVGRTANKTEYYPAISDDSKYVVFDESSCDGPPTPQSSNWGLGPCDSYDDPSARLRIVASAGGTPADLARASGTDNWTTSWPRFSPRHDTFKGKDLYWVAFSSRRPYGATLAGWNGSAAQSATEPQLWFAGVGVDPTGALSGDPSFAPVWMPQQNQAGVPRGNHVPQWVRKAVPLK